MFNIISVGSVTKAQSDEASNSWVTNLGNCLNALQKFANPSIPFHKSRFTLLMRDTLLSLSASSIICSLSPTFETYRFVLQNLNICHKMKKSVPNIVEIPKKLGKLSKNNSSKSSVNSSTQQISDLDSSIDIPKRVVAPPSLTKPNPKKLNEAALREVLKKKTNEILLLTKENQELSEKVNTIESQLQKIQEKQEKQSRQLNALSPSKEIEKPRKVGPRPAKTINNSVNSSTVSDVNEIERYREVMEGSLAKLKGQLRVMEAENGELRKELSKQDLMYKKRIAELVSDMKRDTTQKQIQELNKKVEAMTKTINTLKAQKKVLSDKNNQTVEQMQKLVGENRALKQQLYNHPNNEVVEESYVVDEEEEELEEEEIEEVDEMQPVELPYEISEREKNLEREVEFLQEALNNALAQNKNPNMKISNVKPPFLRNQ